MPNLQQSNSTSLNFYTYNSDNLDLPNTEQTQVQTGNGFLLAPLEIKREVCEHSTNQMTFKELYLYRHIPTAIQITWPKSWSNKLRSEDRRVVQNMPHRAQNSSKLTARQGLGFQVTSGIANTYGLSFLFSPFQLQWCRPNVIDSYTISKYCDLLSYFI